MDIRELKNYIYENEYVEQILESIGCHHIKFHPTGSYWTCANHDGDNQTAIVLYNNEALICTNYTRQMVDANRTTDILDLVCYSKDIGFGQALKFICEEIGLSYYHDFNEDIPESFRILQELDELNYGTSSDEKEVTLKKVNESVLKTYLPLVNELFYNDGINYTTQQEFEIGFDPETNRYTIPIRNEVGDLVGVKGRYFYRDVPDGQNKYIYLEPCPKSKILYGLNRTENYINIKKSVYVTEAEKGVLQLFSYGYINCVATGGKQISETQIDMLTRLGATIILCLDKDVTLTEIETIADRFPNGISVFYIYDEDNILDKKESPSDDKDKWEYLVKNNLYKIR